jgi:6-phosphogluconolactonase
MSGDTFVYVGTYTRPAAYLRETKGKGLYIFRLNPDTGELSPAGEAPGIDNPSYLNVDPAKRHVYAISEVWEWPEGLVRAYAIDPASGGLTYLNQVSSFGWLACYIMVDATNRFAVVSNYMGGNAGLFPIRADGRIGEAVQMVQHTGAGRDPQRQAGPHPHCIVISPNNRHVVVADLGLDKVMVYDLDVEQGRLAPNAVPWVKMPDGSGPRHFVFHSSGRYGYVSNEFNATVSAFTYDPESGRLELIQTVSSLPKDFAGENICADIQVHPSGNFVYVSNRGLDSLTIFAVDPATGRLTYVANQSSLGETPRNFAIEPGGRFLLAANQDSDNIVTFSIDLGTGKLSPTGHVASVPTPNCVKIVPMD